MFTYPADILQLLSLYSFAIGNSILPHIVVFFPFSSSNVAYCTSISTEVTPLQPYEPDDAEIMYRKRLLPTTATKTLWTYFGPREGQGGPDVIIVMLFAPRTNISPVTVGGVVMFGNRSVLELGWS